MYFTRKEIITSVGVFGGPERKVSPFTVVRPTHGYVLGDDSLAFFRETIADTGAERVDADLTFNWGEDGGYSVALGLPEFTSITIGQSKQRFTKIPLGVPCNSIVVLDQQKPTVDPIENSLPVAMIEHVEGNGYESLDKDFNTDLVKHHIDIFVHEKIPMLFAEGITGTIERDA